MAFSPLVTIAPQTQKTAGTSYSPSYGTNASNTYSIGQLVVAAFAFDNLTGTDGDNSEITSIVDTAHASNTWQKAVEFTNGQGAAAGGATISIWYCVLSEAISLGQGFVVTFNGTVTAKVVSIRAFSIGAGNTVAVQGTTTLANDAADAGSMTLSSLPSREYLFVRAVAIENNTSTPGTPETSWTDLATNTVAGTTGGSAVSNMWIYAEYRIQTTTSVTSDPTTGAADCASVLVAFYETTAAAAPDVIDPFGMRGFFGI